MVTTRRRAARRSRAAVPLARDDEQHLGPPPRPRPRLRRGRRRLQLPPGRAARGARAQPPGAAGGEHRGPARDRSRLPRAARGDPRHRAAVQRRRRSSAPRTSPSRCCSPTARRAIASATSSKRAASRRRGTRRCTAFTEYRRFAPPDGLPRATEVADRHCALPLSSTMDETEVDARRRRRPRGARAAPPPQPATYSGGISRSRTDSNSSWACS